MSRTTKLWLLGVPCVAAILWVLGIALQAYSARGTVAAAPGAVTPDGWVQIVLAAIAALETGKGWFATLRTAAEAATTNLSGPNGEAVKVGIDVAALGYYKWQLTKVKDEAQKSLIIKAARLEVDALRDREFPLPAGQ